MIDGRINTSFNPGGFGLGYVLNTLRDDSLVPAGAVAEFALVLSKAALKVSRTFVFALFYVAVVAFRLAAQTPPSARLAFWRIRAGLRSLSVRNCPKKPLAREAQRQ